MAEVNLLDELTCVENAGLEDRAAPVAGSKRAADHAYLIWNGIVVTVLPSSMSSTL